MNSRKRILVAGGLLPAILTVAAYLYRYSPSRTTVLLRDELRQIDDYTLSCWDPSLSAHFHDARLATAFKSLVVEEVVSTSAEDLGCANRLIVTSTATNCEYTFCPAGYLVVYRADEDSGGVYKLRGSETYTQLLKLVPWEDVQRDFYLKRSDRE